MNENQVREYLKEKFGKRLGQVVVYTGTKCVHFDLDWNMIEGKILFELMEFFGTKDFEIEKSGYNGGDFNLCFNDCRNLKEG